jgi:cyclin H
MDYENSTQSRYWMYDEESLAECREKAAVVQSIGNSTKQRVRKFACGFMEQKKLSSVKPSTTECETARIFHLDQETLIHFHAHQIQRLVGPGAIFPQLRRSAAVLSTAIMIFRRFFLSNSVIHFHPRDIAAASALLAVKVDCEAFLEVCRDLNFDTLHVGRANIEIFGVVEIRR